MNINDPSKSATLEDFISEGKNEEINVHVITYVQRMEETIIPIHNIWNKYRDLLFLPSNSVILSLSDTEFEDFIYKPKRLSMTLYKTISLDHLILFLNNMTSVTQFTQKRVRVIRPERTRVLNDIILNEEPYLNRNKNDNRYRV